MKKLRKKTIKGTKDRLRLRIHRSNRNMYAQLIDDDAGNTVISASTYKLDQTGVEASIKTADILAKKANEKNIKRVIFDRGKYLYKGRIKAFIEQLRKNGMLF
ncbi:MAG: 50S ribosomal protein L18 [bacterium]